MIATSIVMIVGLTLVALLSQSEGYRLGGVMVLPLLVIYTFREPFSPVIFSIGAMAAWTSLWLLREYTLNHGRRLFLSSVIVGAIATILVGYAFSRFFPAQLSFENAEVIASIFPGVTAYNVMRLDPDDRRADLITMGAVYLLLVGIGAVSLRILAGVESPTPAILALPTSDIVHWMGIEPHGIGYPTIVPDWVTVTLLFTDIVIYEGFRKRYDHRLAGIIIIPLLAVFSARYAPSVVIYAGGATAVYYLLSYVHWTTLIYGRVLLAISLALGTMYALAIGILQPVSTPGIILFFIGLFVGIGAYNLHRVPPKNRSAHVRISAGLFVVFYAILFVLVDIPAKGLIHSGHGPYALLGVVAVGLALIELYRFERSIPDSAVFARESAFTSASLGDADLDDSPLVVDTEGDDR